MAIKPSLYLTLIHPVTAYFRRQRGVLMRESFPGIEAMTVCDLGGSIHFWQKVGIRLAPDRLTILNVDDYVAGAVPGSDMPAYRVVIYDGQHIPFPDQHFDLLVSNSVIEHVPPAQRVALAAEMRRVAKRLFVQTPALTFPVEQHFMMPLVHWLPRRLGYWLVLVSPWRLLARPNPDQINHYYWGTQLLGRRELQSLFPAARLRAERLLGMAKSLCAVQT